MAEKLARHHIIAPVEDDDVMKLSQSAGIPIAKKDVPDYRGICFPIFDFLYHFILFYLFIFFFQNVFNRFDK